MIGLAVLLASCAPAIHPTTMQAIVQHESRTNQFAIGVNGGGRLERQPTTKAEAVAAANRLIANGVNFDAGFAQINVRNFAWLGLTPETAFDPCKSVEAAQTVLLKGYRSAAATYGPGQQALRVALSYYNTGNPDRGFENGYVNKVIAQVPALEGGVVVTPVPRRAAPHLTLRQRMLAGDKPPPAKPGMSARERMLLPEGSITVEKEK